MTGGPAARAERWARLYPRRWRDQFPDFNDHLADELAEHRPGVRRDLVRAALVERLRQDDLIPRRPADRARSGLALVYASLLPFAALALGVWSQLHTGLSGRGPASSSPPSSVLRASGLLLTAGSPAVLVALPLAVALVVVESRRARRARRALDPGDGVTAPGAGSGRGLVRPVVCLVGSMAALSVTGWAADRSGWYSPAAAALPQRGLGHVVTLWVRGAVATITPAWGHPHLFTTMASGELVAALVAPGALLVASGGLFQFIVRLPRPAPGRASVALAVGAFVMMALSVVASARWLIAHPVRQGATSVLARGDQLAPGHTGWAVVIVLAGLVALGAIGLRRVLRAGRAARPAAPAGASSG